MTELLGMCKEELIELAQREDRIKSDENDFSLITEQGIRYLCNMPYYGDHKKDVDPEITQYFTQLPLISLFAFKKLAKANLACNFLFFLAYHRGYKEDYPDTVRLFRFTSDYVTAFKDNKVNIIEAPFSLVLSTKSMSIYITAIINQGKYELFDRALKRYLHLSSEDELIARESLLKDISFSNIHQNVDLAVKMMYEISPESDLAVFIPILKIRNTRWFSAFAKYSKERNYDWTRYEDQIIPAGYKAVMEALS